MAAVANSMGDASGPPEAVYERRAIIGHGSYGKVWLVIAASNGQKLSMKEMRGDQAALDDAAKEVTLHQQLDHANIIRYYDVVRAPKAFYLIMEYGSGGDLATLLAKRANRLQPLSEDHSLTWLRQLLDATAYLHRRNLIHRDIKSSNIFIMAEGVIKLGDMGCARFLDNNATRIEQRTCSTPCGTPMYQSPEQCRGLPYTQKVDVWALGCVFHEMCTLQPAFHARNMRELGHKIQCGDFSKRLPATLSQDTRHILLSMLELSAHRRPTTSSLLDLPCLKPYEDKRVDSNGLVKPLHESQNDNVIASAAAADDPWRVSRRGSAASRRGSQLPDVRTPNSARRASHAPGSGTSSDGDDTSHAPPGRRRQSSLGLGPSPWGRAYQQQQPGSRARRASEFPAGGGAAEAQANGRRSSEGASDAIGPETRGAQAGPPSIPSSDETAGQRRSSVQGGSEGYQPSQGMAPRRDSRSLDPWRKASRRASDVSTGGADAGRQGLAQRRSSQAVVHEEEKPIPQPSPAALAARAGKVAAKTSAAAPGLAAAVAADGARPPVPEAYRRDSQDIVSEAHVRDRRRRSSDESAASPGRQWLLKDMPSPAALAADVLPAIAAERRRQSNASHEVSSRAWNVPTGRTMRPRHTRGLHRSLFEAPIPVGAPVPWQ